MVTGARLNDGCNTCYIFLTYTFDLINNQIHKLLLLKDLCYHFGNRSESFVAVKPSVKHTITCDFSNKILDDIKLGHIFKTKDAMSCFPYHLFESLMPIVKVLILLLLPHQVLLFAMTVLSGERSSTTSKFLKMMLRVVILLVSALTVIFVTLC